MFESDCMELHETFDETDEESWPDLECIFAKRTWLLYFLSFRSYFLVLPKSTSCSEQSIRGDILCLVICVFFLVIFVSFHFLLPPQHSASLGLTRLRQSILGPGSLCLAV